MRLQRKIKREDELSAANFEMGGSGSVYLNEVIPLCINSIYLLYYI